MKQFTIALDENDNNNLQRAQYEYDTVFDLVSRNMNTPNEYWFNKLVEANTYLQLFKNEITSKYVVPQISDVELTKTTWNADFLNQNIQVTVDD